MPIFGPKPNVVGVVIFYDLNPPTGSEEAEILVAISKKVKLQAKLLGTSKVMEGQRASKEIFDAYVQSVAMLNVAKEGIPFVDTPKIKVDSFGLFTVATVTGRV